DPSAPGEPLARSPLLGALTELILEVSNARRTFKIEAQLSEADARQVCMRIREPGQDGEAVQVHTACPVWRSLQRLGARSDKGDAAVCRENCLRARIPIISSVNITVEEQHRLDAGAWSHRNHDEDPRGQWANGLTN